MSETPIIDGLQLDQDLAHQRRLWIAQRIGWCVIGLILVAALLGLLGDGPLSSVSASDPTGGLHVEYERFLHRQAPTIVKLSIAPSTDAREVSVRIDNQYLDRMLVQNIVPKPRLMRAGADSSELIFDADTSGVAVHAQIQIQADSAGRVRGWIRSGDREVTVRHFVYP